MYLTFFLIIEGYCKDPFRKDRNNSGGGVIVYFSNHLIVQPRTDLNFDSEAIWLEIFLPAYKMLLCVVYRQPNANYSTVRGKRHELLVKRCNNGRFKCRFS